VVTTGLFLTGRTLRIVTLSGTKEDHSILAKKFHKLALPKCPTREDVVIFSQTFEAHCKDHAVDMVLINQRATSGQQAGGTGTFLTEGILLAISSCPVKRVHPATIKATDRKEIELKSIRPETAELKRAYDIAFEGLE
jgi:DUF3010 family protein